MNRKITKISADGTMRECRPRTEKLEACQHYDDQGRWCEQKADYYSFNTQDLLRKTVRKVEK
jgi:hypothetical protein